MVKKWSMGVKEANVVGSVWWRMFMKPQKGMKVVYGIYDMIWKTSLWAHLHPMFKVPLVNLCELPWDGIVKCCKWDVHAFVSLEWNPDWILFPLLGWWLHWSLGWQVSLHGFYLCVLCAGLWRCIPWSIRVSPFSRRRRSKSEWKFNVHVFSMFIILRVSCVIFNVMYRNNINTLTITNGYT